MVKFWQVSKIALKSSCRRCSIKKAVLKNLAILIGKHLCWSLFLTNFQAYKTATLLQRDSNTGGSCEHCEIFKNLYFKGHLWTTASGLYWFEVEEIIGKTKTYPETIIGDVFRAQWNIYDEAFCKNSWLYLTHQSGKEIEEKLHSIVLLT